MGDLTTYSYTRTNGKGATESRITTKNNKDCTVTSLLTFCDGKGKAFSQEWGVHVGDDCFLGDNTEMQGPPCDGFNDENFCHLPTGWSEALVMTGSGRPVGNGLATIMRGPFPATHSIGDCAGCPAFQSAAGPFAEVPVGGMCAKMAPDFSCGGAPVSPCNPSCGGPATAAASSAPASAPKPISPIELKPLGAQV